MYEKQHEKKLIYSRGKDIKINKLYVLFKRNSQNKLFVAAYWSQKLKFAFVIYFFVFEYRSQVYNHR